MFKEETKELKMSNEFRKKIEMICKYACVKYELVNGNIISIKKWKKKKKSKRKRK